MKKIESFTNLYSVNKTIRNRLIPIGKTEENFINARLLEQDKTRAINYSEVKKMIDNYHREFIDSILSRVQLEGLEAYSALYFKKNKTAEEKVEMEKCEVDLRKQLGRAFSADKKFAKLFNADMIKELLPAFVDEENREIIATFTGFATYFSGFHENRKNMYKDESIATAIPYRCINDNLPKFLDNIRIFEKIKDALAEQLIEMEGLLGGDHPRSIDTVFELNYFNRVLSAEGIKRYNELIGGYSTSDGKKVKGINEYINLYNQDKSRNKKLPFMKALFKQILSDAEGISFVPEQFASDDEVIESIEQLWGNGSKGMLCAVHAVSKLFSEFEKYDETAIYIENGVAVTSVSNAVFHSWAVISEGWNRAYDKENLVKEQARTEKYVEKRQKEYKANKSFSIADLQKWGELAISETEVKNEQTIVQYYNSEIVRLCKELEDAHFKYANCKKSEVPLRKNKELVSAVKELFDGIKQLERYIKSLMGTGKEETKDELFYGQLLPLYVEVSKIDRLYDKVRNYITKKPYSTDKVKLNFENEQLLGGWDRNKEEDYGTVLLRKDGKYYLAIMDKRSKRVFRDIPYKSGEACYEKMHYKLIPGPNKQLPRVLFAKKNLELFAPSQRILTIYEKGTFIKGKNFNLEDCHQLIDYYKECLKIHPEWSKFGFEFKNTKDYADISQFYREVAEQGYTVEFRPVSETYINELVDEGKIYLFQIYNKDFSDKSKGKPNLHTIYFKMLFDEKNLSNVVYQLNGSAEMFYREASLKKEKPEHPAGKPIKNKNQLNPKKESVFTYDIYKDKRYMENQFFLHLPITLNYKASRENSLNLKVREMLKCTEKTHVIGIDRGERNLLYYCVVDENGIIKEQGSLNTIQNTSKDISIQTDYHNLLDNKENKRKKERQEWETIENIKELKEGYLSQAVHKICELVVKYDAIIALEDLNSGFKNSRAKVEKQVYQKFEKMLTDKLHYYVDKNVPDTDLSGALNALQLTNSPANKNKNTQDGFIFYVPAWMTSKIDPVTGFVNLLDTRYKNVEQAKEFVKKIDDVVYIENENVFAFDIDYSKFERGSISCRKKWKVFTHGDRIRTFMNKDKNNLWDTETVYLTEELKKLFIEHGIDYQVNLKEQILGISNKKFFVRFMELMRLTMQLRNSVTGNIDIDYIISPVKDESGKYYDSRNYKEMSNSVLPKDADANGAYNIARKALYAVGVIKETDYDRLHRAKLYPTNKEWLEFIQNNG